MKSLIIFLSCDETVWNQWDILSIKLRITICSMLFHSCNSNTFSSWLILGADICLRIRRPNTIQTCLLGLRNKQLTRLIPTWSRYSRATLIKRGLALSCMKMPYLPIAIMEIIGPPNGSRQNNIYRIPIYDYIQQRLPDTVCNHQSIPGNFGQKPILQFHDGVAAMLDL